MAKDAKNTQNKKNIREDNKKVIKHDNTQEAKNVIEVKKEKNAKGKKVSEKVISTVKKVDDYRTGIVLFVVGFLIATLLFRCVLWPDRIATLKDGTQPIANLGDKVITADDLYGYMKEHYSVNVLINEIDDMILSKKYKEDDEMNEEVSGTADYYYQVYEQSYGYTKEEFLSEYGFSTEEEFIESLKLDYRRNKYYDEYALSLVTDKEIENYYKDEVFGDVDTKHILVSIEKDKEDGLTDEEAKKLANEIIDKLNKGTSWDDVVKEYKDKIIHEELGYQSFNASLESAYLKESKNLKKGTYSKSPVLTSYGYHIVYKIDQKDKPKLKDVRDDIKDIIANDKKSSDTNLYYKSLIIMRENAKLEFVDTKLGEEYKTFTSSYK